MTGKHLHLLARESCDQYYHQVHLVGGSNGISTITRYT